MLNKVVEIAEKQNPLGTVTWGDLVGVFKGVRDETPHVTLPVRAHFTDEEIELIKQLAEQKETKEIALFMRITPHMVEKLRGSIREKMGVKNTIGIVMYAVKHNIIRVE